MANQTITARLKVQAEGIKEAVGDAKELRKELSAAEKAAAASKPTGASRARAAAMAGSAGPAENIEYGRMRGIGSATGAASRDFANQAQGLGGLVRLYATFAANIFAVSAAFSALKNAADTTNLIKGLDQLGARSGIALGQLALEFSKATDGIVSLREAAEVTAKASASGLSNKQILEIAKVAKSASQALGVDALDAVNRLTRGITKLEPELLDELGIFTKIDPAVQEYARSLNKTAGALTDFERRQAFAVAALKEGADKFGAIELDANPYSKLLASTKDVAQQVLEFVNRALTPLVGLLASSPTALLGVITAIGTLLLKQAIPAVGEFRAGLERQAQDAAERAKQRQADATAAAATAAKARRAFEENTIEALLAKQEAAEKRYEGATKAKLDRSKTASKLLIDDITKVSDADIAAARAEADKLEKGRKAYREQGKSLRELADSTEAARNAQQAYTVAAAEDLRAIEARKKGLGILALNQRIAEAAARDAAINEIKSNAARTASLSGLSDAFALTNKQIGDSGLKGFDKFRAGIGAFTSALGGALSTVLRFASAFLGWIGIIGSVIGILDSFMDKSKEALGAFETAMDRADKATKHLGETFKAIFKNDAYSVQAIQARANALTEQSAAMDQLTESAIKAKAALTDDTWGRIKDTFASLFGGGVQKNFEKTLTKQLVDTINNLDDAGIKEKLTKAIQGELQVSEVNFNSLAKAVQGLDPASETVRRLNAAIKQTSVDSAEAASKATEFAEGFKKGTQLFADLKTQFADKSPITQWAVQSNQSLEQLALNMDGPIQNSIANLTTALTGMSKNPIFGPQAGARLLEFANAMKTARDESKQAAKELDSVNRKIAELEQKSTKAQQEFDAGTVLSPEGGIGGTGASYTETKDYQDFVDQITKLRKEAATLEAKQQKAFADAERIRTNVAGALTDGVRFSAGIVAKTINAQIQKGATEFLQQYYAAFDTVPEFAGRVIDLKIQEIGIQLDLIKQQKELVVSQERLSATYQKVSAEEKVRALEAAGQGPNQGEAGSEDYQKAVRDVKFYTEALDTLNSVIKNPVQALKNLSNQTGNLSAEQIKQVGIYQQLGLSVAGFNAQIAQQGRQIAHLKNVEKPIAILRAENKAFQERNEYERQRNDVLRQRLQLQMTGLDDIGRAELSLQNYLLNVESARLDAERERGDAELKYQERLIIANQLKSEGERDRAYTEIELQRRRALGVIDDKESLKIQQAKAETIRQQSAAELQTLNQKFELENNIRQIASSAAMANLAIDKARTDAAISINKYTEGYIAQLQFTSAIKDAETQKEFGRIQAEAAYRKTIEEITIREREARELQSAGIITEGIKKLRLDAAERDRQLADSNRAATIAGLDIEFNKSKAIADVTLQTALYQAKFNEELDRSTRYAEALEGAFGNVGKKLAELTNALTTYGQTQEKNANTMKDLQDKMTMAIATDDQEEQQKLETEIAKQKKKSKDDELAGNAKVLASSKNMFKQHTAAYKGLAALEKAMHIMRIVNAGIEMAMTLKKTALQVTSSVAAETAATAATATGVAARAPMNIADIFGKSTGQLGPIVGPAIAAALVAMIYGALGGGKGKTINVPNAAQRQETQGTAFQYEGNKKVQVRRGVFGAEDQKSESISRSLEVIKENSVDGLTYDNKILSALQSIDRGINNTAKGLVRISGLRSGSMFGTTEGTQSGRGLLGTGLFASKTSREIQDSGIIIRGSFNELASTTNQTALEFFEQLKVTKKKWWGSTKTSIEENNREVDDKVSGFFADIFGNATKLIKQIATDTKTLSINQVDEILRDFKIDQKISFRGLSGEDLKKEVESVISSILDDVTLAVFDQFEQYAKFGEGMLETVIRVTDTNTKIAQQIKNLSITAPDLTGAYAITEALAEAAGGLEEFISKTQFFRDTFLTEAERLAPVRLAVEKQLKNLADTYKIGSIATIKTREDFKLLVQAIDVTKPNMEALYVKLLELAPAFAEVTKEAENTITALLSDLKLEIADFENNTSELEKSLRDITNTGLDYIKQLREAGQATEENVEIVAKWAKLSALAQIDEDIRKLYETRRNEINGTIDSLKAAKTRLVDLKNALLQGTQSILTPQQKYTQLIEDYTTTLAAAKAGDKTALERFPQLSQSLLDSGREMFSSSQIYTDLFTRVMGDITGLDLSLDKQLTDAQKQLAELESQTNFLSKIDASTDTTAKKLSELIGMRETYAALSPATLAKEIVAGILAEDVIAKARVQAKASAINEELNTKITSVEPPKVVTTTPPVVGPTGGQVSTTPPGAVSSGAGTVVSPATLAVAVTEGNKDLVTAVTNLNSTIVGSDSVSSDRIVNAIVRGSSSELYNRKNEVLLETLNP